MEVRVDEVWRLPLQLTELVRKAKDEADSFKQECADLGKRNEKLAGLLIQAARFPGTLYQSPTKRILVEVAKCLEKALTLLKRCKRSGILRRVITITSAGDFKKVTSLLESSIGDLTWLLNVSAVGEDRSDYIGLPPIASMDPLLAIIWEQVSLVQFGTLENKADAAAVLASYAKDNERNGKLVIEERGLSPLVKLLKADYISGQEAAANCLGVLASEEQRVKDILDEGVVPFFVQVLNNGSMKVQVKVAWALAQMVSHSNEAKDAFASAGAIRSLVHLLAYDTLEDTSNSKKSLCIHTLVKGAMEQTKCDTSSVNKPVDPGETNGHTVADDDTKVTSIGKLVDSTAFTHTSQQDHRENNLGKPSWGGSDSDSQSNKGVAFMKPKSGTKLPPRTSDFRTASFDYRTSPENGRAGGGHVPSLRHMNRQEREREDPETKAMLKAEAAHALWKLAENSVKNSKSITDTRALLCFAKLIEHGEGSVQMNSVKAVMEIAAAAEKDAELRRAAFKTNSPAAKAVVDQLLNVIRDGEPELQIPCIRAIGSLAHIFPAPASKVIQPLTAHLGNKDGLVAAAAAAALQNFANQSNYLRLEHSKTILELNGASNLVQLIYFGESLAKLEALILLSYLSLNCGDSDHLETADSLKALELSGRSSNLPEYVMALLDAAIDNLGLYHSGSHVSSGNYV